MQNVVIIGSGPAGLTAGIYCGRAKLRPIIITGLEDKKKQIFPGGQLVISDSVENFPGFPDPISGKKLTQDLMMRQAEKSGAIFLHEEVIKVELTENSPKVIQTNNRQIKTQAIIIATGATAKWLRLPNEEKYMNLGISTCAVCDATELLNNRHIVVVGGGDTAMEEALYLTKYSKNVTLIHRRTQFRASQIMQDRVLNNKNINIIWSSTIIDYHGEGRLSSISIKNEKSSEISKLDLSALFIAIGHIPNTKFLEGSGLKLNENGYVITENNVFTNLAGIFACGDVHDTRYRQAVTASGFGCMAAMESEKWIDTNGIFIKETQKFLEKYSSNEKEHIPEVNYTQLLNRVQNEKELIFIDVIGTNCPICEVFIPILNSFSKKYPDIIFISINIDKIDFDDRDEFEDNIGSVYQTPTYFLFRSKALIEKYLPSSFNDKNKVEEMILRNL